MLMVAARHDTTNARIVFRKLKTNKATTNDTNLHELHGCVRYAHLGRKGEKKTSLDVKRKTSRAV